MSTTSPPTETVTGIVIVDHGSRRGASNDMLLEAAAAFKASAGYAIVEPAHMEIAEPDIATAYERCVAQGARRIVVFPYFLSPGKHWKHDIPALVEAAAAAHPHTEWLVTAPFGLHPQMQQIIADRIDACLQAAHAQPSVDCDVCGDGEPCRLRPGGPVPRSPGTT